MVKERKANPEEVKVIVLHGPNLNRLGSRETEIYGSWTLEQINQQIYRQAEDLSLKVEIHQSNHEGEMVEIIHRADDEGYHGIVINPAAFTHYSVALRDALASIRIPVVEVHLSNLHAREEFRSKSITAPHTTGQVVGLGYYGYCLALQALWHELQVD